MLGKPGIPLGDSEVLAAERLFGSMGVGERERPRPRSSSLPSSSWERQPVERGWKEVKDRVLPGQDVNPVGLHPQGGILVDPNGGMMAPVGAAPMFCYMPQAVPQLPQHPQPAAQMAPAPAAPPPRPQTPEVRVASPPAPKRIPRRRRSPSSDSSSAAGDPPARGRGGRQGRGRGRRRVPDIETEDDSEPSSSAFSNPGMGRRRQVLPDKFDGTSLEWPEYLRHFMVVAEVNQWNRLEKGLYLASSLTGEARRILTGLKPEQCRSFAVLVERLGKRFDPACQEETHRAALRGRMRKTAETSQAYAQSIRRLVERSYPHLGEEAHETIALESFLKGHADGDMKLMALMRDMKTLEEATAFITQYESVNRKPVKPVRMLKPEDEQDEPLLQLAALLRGGKKDDGNKDTGPRLPYFKGLFEAQDKKMDRVLELLGTVVEGMTKKEDGATASTVPTERTGPKECWLCKKPGHFSRECPQRPKDIRALASLLQRLGEDMDGLEDAEKEETSDEVKTSSGN